MFHITKTSLAITCCLLFSPAVFATDGSEKKLICNWVGEFPQKNLGMKTEDFLNNEKVKQALKALLSPHNYSRIYKDKNLFLESEIDYVDGYFIAELISNPHQDLEKQRIFIIASKHMNQFYTAFVADEYSEQEEPLWANYGGPDLPVEITKLVLFKLGLH